MKFPSMLSRFRRDQSGAIMLFIVFAITTIIGASAVAFEMSRYAKAKARFNNALDQAVLATAAANSPDPAAYGTKYFNTNLSAEMPNITVNSLSFSVTGNRETWQADATGSMPTVFARFIGMTSLELNHHATVGWDMNSQTEIVALMDVSGTMCAKFERVAQSNGATAIDIVPDPSCTKLNQMKEAIKEVVNIGVGYNGLPGSPAYKVGIIPFTYKLKVANPNNIPDFVLQGETDGNFGADYYKNVTDAEGSAPPIPNVTPLMNINSAADKQAFLARADALSTGTNQEINRPFMKRSAMGALFAALMLDPAHTSIFGGAAPAPLDSPTRKIVILMTDSANLGCCYTNWPADNFRNHYVYSYAPDHEVLVGGSGQKGVCETMKEEGIEIFTVLFDVDRRDMDVRGEQIVDSFQSCASSPEMAFEIPFNDTQKLKEAYTIIGKSVMNLQLTK